MSGVIRFQDVVRRIAGAISCNQHRHQVFRRTTGAGLAAAFTRIAVEPFALTLVGAQEECLVGLGDTHRQTGLHGLWRSQEPVAPAESRVPRYTNALADLGERQAITQRRSLVKPLPLHSQPRQRRAGQRIEGPATGSTPVPLQPTGRAVLDHLRATATRAAGLLVGGTFESLRSTRPCARPGQAPRPPVGAATGSACRGRSAAPSVRVVSSELPGICAPPRHGSSIRQSRLTKMSPLLINDTTAFSKLMKIHQLFMQTAHARTTRR